uniref:La protein n=1 Tax=Anisakis simplex TaxID=6269 RepID=A0A0M3KHY9_ANISI
LPAAILPPNAPSVRGQGYHPMPAYTSPPPFNGDAPILSVINEDGNAPRNRRGTTRENQRERHSDQPRRGRNADNYSTNETMNTHNSYGRKKQGGGPRFNQKYAEGDS